MINDETPTEKRYKLQHEKNGSQKHNNAINRKSCDSDNNMDNVLLRLIVVDKTGSIDKPCSVFSH